MKQSVGIEYSGVGLFGGISIGLRGIKVAKSPLEINFDDADKILVVSDLSTVIMLKAEVVGVKGIVIKGDLNKFENDRIKIKLPIVSLEEDKFEQLVSSDLTTVKSASVDGNEGKLSLVV